MNLVVMKFGGTSVEDPAAIGRTAAIVAGRVAHGQEPRGGGERHGQGDRPVAARGGRAAQGDRKGALAISSRLRSRHRDTACALVKNQRTAALSYWIEEKFDALDEVLRGLAAILELTPRISDLIVSYGERLSSRIVAAAFRERGIDAAHADAREFIVTDSRVSESHSARRHHREARAGEAAAADREGKVPVMGGFIARTKRDSPPRWAAAARTYTGALVGGALDAEQIEIWTDVDGIMTADPRVCPDALRVKVISFEEAAELAYFGAKVLHPATILPAVKKNIPVLVLNSRNALAKARASSRCAALQEPVQVHRGQEKAEHHRHRGQPHADDARLPEPDFRDLRQAQVPGRHGFDERGFGLAHCGLERNSSLPEIAADLSAGRREDTRARRRWSAWWAKIFAGKTASPRRSSTPSAISTCA
jgi:aspartate kinase